MRFTYFCRSAPYRLRPISRRSTNRPRTGDLRERLRDEVRFGAVVALALGPDRDRFLALGEVE